MKRILMCFAFSLLFMCTGLSIVKADTKWKVDKQYEKTTYIPYEMKNGKIVYFYKHGLYQKLENGSYKKITKYKLENVNAIKGFYDEYVYFNNTSNRLCRVKYDGKGEKKYKVDSECGNLLKVMDGFIYYNSPEYLLKINVKNGKVIKLLDLKDIYIIKINETDILYSALLKDDDFIYGEEYYSISLDGSEIKKIRAEIPTYVENYGTFEVEGTKWTYIGPKTQDDKYFNELKWFENDVTNYTYNIWAKEGTNEKMGIYQKVKIDKAGKYTLSINYMGGSGDGIAVCPYIDDNKGKEFQTTGWNDNPKTWGKIIFEVYLNKGVHKVGCLCGMSNPNAWGYIDNISLVDEVGKEYIFKGDFEMTREEIDQYVRHYDVCAIFSMKKDYFYLCDYNKLHLYYREEDNCIYRLCKDGKFRKFISDKKYEECIIDNIEAISQVGKYLKVANSEKIFFYDKNGKFVTSVKTTIKKKGIKYKQYQIVVKNKKIIIRYKSKKGIVIVTCKAKKK